MFETVVAFLLGLLFLLYYLRDCTGFECSATNPIFPISPVIFIARNSTTRWFLGTHLPRYRRDCTLPVCWGEHRGGTGPRILQLPSYRGPATQGFIPFTETTRHSSQKFSFIHWEAGDICSCLALSWQLQFCSCLENKEKNPGAMWRCHGNYSSVRVWRTRIRIPERCGVVMATTDLRMCGEPREELWSNLPFVMATTVLGVWGKMGRKLAREWGMACQTMGNWPNRQWEIIGQRVGNDRSESGE
jgi:hypothetical protein